MALDIPSLGKKEFREISQELINSIPRYSKTWTNFNPSDPGISLIEALSFVADNLFYTMDRLPEVSYLYYLRRIGGATDKEQINKLINKLSFQGISVDQSHIDFLNYLLTLEEKNENGQLQYSDIPEMKGQVLKFLKSRFRAVTEGDYHSLVREVPAVDGKKIVRSFLDVGETRYDRTVLTIVADEVWPYTPVIFEPIKTQRNPHYDFDHPPSPIKEVIEVFPRGFSHRINPANLPNLLANMPATRTDFDTYTYNVEPVTDYNYINLVHSAIDYMEPRRLVGSRLEVIKPAYTQVDVDMLITCESPYVAEKAVKLVVDKFQKYFDPITGGPDGDGWPYKRSVTVHEAFHLLESMDEVDAVLDFKFNGQNITEVTPEGLFDLTRISVQTMES